MKRPRLSIAWAVFGTAIVAWPCAVLAAILQGRSLVGLPYCLDVGLLPTGVVFGVGLFTLILDRGPGRAFIRGFVITGWLAVMGYVVGCLVIPDVMMIPDRYYINEVEPRILDDDTFEGYSLSLLIRGSILAAPQFLLALFGGLLNRSIIDQRKGPSEPEEMPYFPNN